MNGWCLLLLSLVVILHTEHNCFSFRGIYLLLLWVVLFSFFLLSLSLLCGDFSFLFGRHQRSKRTRVSFNKITSLLYIIFNYFMFLFYYYFHFLYIFDIIFGWHQLWPLSFPSHFTPLRDKNKKGRHSLLFTWKRAVTVTATPAANLANTNTHTHSQLNRTWSKQFVICRLPKYRIEHDRIVSGGRKRMILNAMWSMV